MAKIYRFFSILLAATFSFLMAHTQPKEGIWRGTLDMQGMKLPFNFEMRQDNGQWRVWLLNADERLEIKKPKVTDDSVYWKMNLFDSYISAAIEGDHMEGVFVKNYSEDYQEVFRADYGLDYRFFPDSDEPVTDFSGRWAINFPSEEDTITSVGIFKQQANRIWGTILTSTGDYRYLQGNVKGSSLYLSTFDGAHDFIFQASQLTPGKLVGLWLYGKTYKEGWTAVKDPKAEIPDPTRIAYSKKKSFEFSLPGIDGGTVSLDNPALKGKPVLLQIFGTWCSNSMDLSQFVHTWLQQNPEYGFEWVGLSFETNDDLAYAKKRLENWKEYIGANDVTLAFGGRAEKASASKQFPTLSRVNAYPTLIILDKDHVPVRTYGFFNGPATGAYYEAFKEDFQAVVDSLR